MAEKTPIKSTVRMAHDFQEKPRTTDVMIQEQIYFSGLFLSEAIQQGLESAGFEKPSPVQLKAIPLGRCGLDLIVQAKSGTGKTCVLSVIALESLNLMNNSIQVLILAPTREIAIQIKDVTSAIGSKLERFKCEVFIGGIAVSSDTKRASKCHIAVGTPGRVMQLIQQKVLKMDSTRLFILDEADKLLDESLQEQVNWIYSSLPSNKQVVALSATYPEYLANQLTMYMKNATFVRLNSSQPALLGIKQYVHILPFQPLAHMTFQLKTDYVTRILSEISFQQCLVFSNLHVHAQSLCDLLNSQGWPAECISGSQNQSLRSETITKLKQLKCRVLISTDLTSRGIDAEHVNLVINLDVPNDPETYLHRIGRAGRFGSTGIAITLVCRGKEQARLHAIQNRFNIIVKKLPDTLSSDLATNHDIWAHCEDAVLASAVHHGKQTNDVAHTADCATEAHEPLITEHVYSSDITHPLQTHPVTDTNSAEMPSGVLAPTLINKKFVTYSREELLEYRKNPVSQQSPMYIKAIWLNYPDLDKQRRHEHEPIGAKSQTWPMKKAYKKTKVKPDMKKNLLPSAAVNVQENGIDCTVTDSKVVDAKQMTHIRESQINTTEGIGTGHGDSCRFPIKIENIMSSLLSHRSVGTDSKIATDVLSKTYPARTTLHEKPVSYYTAVDSLKSYQNLVKKTTEQSPAKDALSELTHSIESSLVVSSIVGTDGVSSVGHQLQQFLQQKHAVIETILKPDRLQTIVRDLLQTESSTANHWSEASHNNAHDIAQSARHAAIVNDSGCSPNHGISCNHADTSVPLPQAYNEAQVENCINSSLQPISSQVSDRLVPQPLNAAENMSNIELSSGSNVPTVESSDALHQASLTEYETAEEDVESRGVFGSVPRYIIDAMSWDEHPSHDRNNCHNEYRQHGGARACQYKSQQNTASCECNLSQDVHLHCASADTATKHRFSYRNSGKAKPKRNDSDIATSESCGKVKQSMNCRTKHKNSHAAGTTQAAYNESIPYMHCYYSMPYNHASWAQPSVYVQWQQTMHEQYSFQYNYMQFMQEYINQWRNHS